MAAKAKSGTLTANTVTTVTLTDVGTAGINVINRSYVEGTSTTPIWVRVGNSGVTVTDPTVAGDECRPVYGARNFTGDTQMTVKMISTGALSYTVEGAR